MTVQNEIDRLHLALDAIDRVPRLGAAADHVVQKLRDKLVEHGRSLRAHGEDLPEIRDWVWRSATA